MAWNIDPIPGQSGRTFVITGANGGLGAEMTRTLAASGAAVIMACRSRERALAIARTAPGDVTVLPLDLADLSSVRAFAGDCGAIDVLINNAGLMNVPFARSVDGFEMQLAVNHLGHFALTGLLLDRIRDRVVSISSIAHRWTGRFPENPNMTEGRYLRPVAYARAKLATLMFGRELERRLRAADAPLRSYVAHPGVAPTGLVARTGTALDRIAEPAVALVGQTRSAAVRSILHAALTPQADPNVYWGPTLLFNTRGPIGPSPSSRLALDRSLWQQLWIYSEDATGVRFPIGSPRTADDPR
ncbi:SDR family NAD(P)-dependent oxidoreductase [Nocardia sp. NPDC127579]|uniref:SDR family NAD(P)-dependent oxidoreductase n=1 Tax=Nocardia sp. NPDC127579 TaxID=3345402 RepID=UPI003631EB4E